MTPFLTTSVGRLRLIAFLEGVSFIALLFIAVPVKHYLDNPMLVKVIGPIHGGLFLMYVYMAFNKSVDYQWKFKEITWQVLLASVVPFGTFYVDHKILKHLKME